MKNKILALILCLLIPIFFTSCGKATTPAEKIGKFKAVITVKDYGDIELELDGDTAPITVDNFVKLAKDGFYDGLTFHRIIEGHMIQGGDPQGTGYGGSEKNITGEFKKNGIENNISHERGTISMARSVNYNSASSQFFIVQVTSDAIKQTLDGNYAAFGKVTKGIEIVDKIAQDTPVVDADGTVTKTNQPIIEKIIIE
ncbi:MAG: peptidylprolyl isomerase [Clostridia bacterium]|nr:peptidylprolyl isomerase [Clostridia bacterium]